MPTMAGTPQGGSCSPLFALIAVHGMDEAITQLSPEARVIAYADDCLVLHPARAALEHCQQLLDGMAGEDRADTARQQNASAPHRRRRAPWSGLPWVPPPSLSGGATPIWERPRGRSASRGQNPDDTGQGQCAGTACGAGSRHAGGAKLAPSGLDPQAQPQNTRWGQ